MGEMSKREEKLFDKHRFEFIARFNSLKRVAGVPDFPDPTLDYCGEEATIHTIGKEAADTVANLAAQLIVPPHRNAYYSTHPEKDPRNNIRMRDLGVCDRAGRHYFMVTFPVPVKSMPLLIEMTKKLRQKLIAPSKWYREHKWER